MTTETCVCVSFRISISISLILMLVSTVYTNNSHTKQKFQQTNIVLLKIIVRYYIFNVKLFQ